MNCWIKFWLAWRQCPAHISPYKILFSSLQLTFSCNLLLHDLTHDECIEICKEHLHSFYPTSSRCVFSSGVGFSSSISFSHYARQLELECQLEYRTLDRKWLNYSGINKFKDLSVWQLEWVSHPSRYARQVELECQLENSTLDRKWLNYSRN